MKWQLLISPAKIADESRRFGRDLAGVQVAGVRLLESRLNRAVAEALAECRSQIPDAARAQVELQAGIRIDLALLRALRLIPERQLQIAIVDALARHQLV